MKPGDEAAGRMPAEVPQGSLGWHLQQARISHGLTIQELRDRTGLTTSYLAQLETGTRCNPTYEVLVALAGVYGITVPELLLWDPALTLALERLRAAVDHYRDIDRRLSQELLQVRLDALGRHKQTNS